MMVLKAFFLLFPLLHGGNSQGCMTVDGQDPNTECVFPFNFGGVTYDGCIFVGTAYPGETRPWCSTQTDGNGDHVMGQGKWGYCSAEASSFISVVYVYHPCF